MSQNYWVPEDIKMVEYIYTNVTGKIKPLLEKIRRIGVPPKLRSLGLKQLVINQVTTEH
jgi:hypothetical protein